MRRVLMTAVVSMFAWLGAHGASAGEGPEPWRLGEAYKQVTGREADAEVYKTIHYQNWSSYRDLCNKVRAKYTSKGAAYVFIKPCQAARQGHIGWGFMDDNGEYICGSTENPVDNAHPERALYIAPGGDNKFWLKTCTTEEEMLRTMATATSGGSSGYWHYKYTPTENRNARGARDAAEWCRANGFDGIGNNCLDQTLRVLQAYGAGSIDSWGRVLPVINQWPIHKKEGEKPIYVPIPGFTKITPNDWFNSFGRIENGVAVSGSGFGERLPGVGSSMVAFGTVGSWFGMQEKVLAADVAEPWMVRLQDWDHEKTQQWFFDEDPNNRGYYFISNKAVTQTSKEGEVHRVLDVPRGTSDCVYLTMYAKHGGDNQLWALEPWPAGNPDRYAIRNKMTGQYLTLAGGNTADGTGLCQYPNVEHHAQRWQFR